MDRHNFRIWKHVGTQKISTTRSKLGVSCRSQYVSMDDEDVRLKRESSPRGFAKKKNIASQEEGKQWEKLVSMTVK